MSRRRGFLVGIGAGLAALLVSYIIRIFLGGVFLPELGAQTLVTLTPGSVESTAVENLGSLAKYTTFSVGIVLNAIIYGIIGAFVLGSEKLRTPGKPEKALMYSLITYLVLLPIAVALYFTTQVLSSPISLPGLPISFLPPQFIFGAILASSSVAVTKPTDLCKAVATEGVLNRKRRLIIKTGLAAGVAAVILFYGVDLLFSKGTGSPGSLSSAESSLFSQAVTPNESFYRVDVNVFPPSVDPAGWNLNVSGMVDSPLSLTLDQLEARAVVEQYNTLECVSNKVGGDLISTALWKGVKLKDILDLAGLQQGAEYVVFKCTDGYDAGIPIDRALLDGTLLAFQMNGAPLPQEHGYPLRAIVPGLYGMMNAKWIKSIEIVNNVYQGYWQRRGWKNDAEYQTGSEIVVPGSAPITDRFAIPPASSIPLGKVPIAGIAFAGDRGISKVQVSTDGGNTWSIASLRDPLSGYTWVFWSSDWNPPSAGNYTLVVRATDKLGNVQTVTATSPFPNGATGYHIVDITVNFS